MRIVVCSLSPSKSLSVVEAFSELLPDVDIEYISIHAESGIHIQPKGLQMTSVGAINRISDAKRLHNDVDYFVAIESGVDLLAGNTIICFSIIAIFGVRQNFLSLIPGSSLPLPYDIYFDGLYRDTKDVGEITDNYFGTIESKKNKGAFHLISNGKFSRESVDAQDIKHAFLPFLSEHYGLKKIDNNLG